MTKCGMTKHVGSSMFLRASHTQTHGGGAPASPAFLSLLPMPKLVH